MVLVGLWSLALRWRRRLYDSRMLLRLAALMGPTGFVAVLAGWITTEVGRQPYTVYGLLRTAQSVSPIALPGVAASLVAFIVVYFVVFGAGIFYILRLMAQPPQLDEPDLEPGAPIRAAGITPAPSLAATPSTTAGG
jgi:cytochrome d ubiquinol oxidase subunit I